MVIKNIDARSDFQKKLDKFKERVSSEFVELQRNHQDWSNEQLCTALAKIYGRDARTIRRHLQDTGTIN